jgi:RsmE family RNA methyltransferase
MQNVQKAAIGDSLRVGLLNGKTGNGIITSKTTVSCSLEVSLVDNPPLSLPVILLLALPRPKALCRIIETVTAMGVKQIYIIESWRVEKGFWNSPALEPGSLREHCILGLEQACDTIMPAIFIRRRFKPFAEDEVPALIANTRALVAHPGAIAECPRQVSEAVTLAIGPEGGFIPYEIELLKKQGFLDVNMGARILRVENAVPALLARLF